MLNALFLIEKTVAFYRKNRYNNILDWRAVTGMTISENVAQIKEELALAARKAGRDPSDIILLGASKMNDVSRIREAFQAGVVYFGENRVQEMTEKAALGAYVGAHLHFIGHLQKNKVKQVVGVAELIHGADSVELLEVIGRLAEKKGFVQDVLLEVNIGGESSKSGFSPAALLSALDSCEKITGIRVRGLMTIPPVCSSPEEIYPYFDRMYQLFVDIGEKKYDTSNMDFLSMGMSHDFASAIAFGSNLVRIGTGIFGARHYGSMP